MQWTNVAALDMEFDIEETPLDASLPEVEFEDEETLDDMPPEMQFEEEEMEDEDSLTAELARLQAELEETQAAIDEKEAAEKLRRYKSRPQIFLPVQGLLTPEERKRTKRRLNLMCEERVNINWTRPRNGLGVDYTVAANDPERRARIWDACSVMLDLLPKAKPKTIPIRGKARTVTWSEAMGALMSKDKSGQVPRMSTSE